MNVKMEYKNVNKYYGKKRVLNDFNLEVYDGEFLVILGPSGMGKSTLLRTTVGIEEMTSGKIILDGEDISRKPPNKRNIAMVFQNYALYPNMTAYKNIEFPLKMAKVDQRTIREKIERIADTLKISEVLERNVNLLSGGQKQRVALARALVRDPKIFLLDEPLSNLDARVRYTARGELKKIQKELGHTFVYVTHDQTEAATLSDRVAVLRNGQIEQIGSFDEILNEPKTKWVGDFVGEYPMNFIDGAILGLKDKIIGFRSHWVTKGDQIKAHVDWCNHEEDRYIVRCFLDTDINDDDEKRAAVVIKTEKPYEYNDPVSFSLVRYNVYDMDGKLVGKNNE
ncbi:ABC transporter ATP-binding protein [Cuniculiplasma sp. SKW3]|uniref:ABC transporter ATP-binding protein n=1 Tax=Cuniculiplasma sp. SKW3 TaxID=3400170 RepID=UPI003FD47F4D